jgi:hypothetical protein
MGVVYGCDVVCVLPYPTLAAGNDFGGVGDSAIVSLGRAQRELNGQDHTDGLFPAGNRIAYNHVHDYGLYGKQTSCYFQSKSCGNIIEFNLCYNGPRAGDTV